MSKDNVGDVENATPSYMASAKTFIAAVQTIESIETVIESVAAFISGMDVEVILNHKTDLAVQVISAVGQGRAQADNTSFQEPNRGAGG